MEQHPKFVDFNGYRFRLSGSYYRKNCWSQPGPSNLHRAVWEKSNGPIPKGMEIHHIDGNSFNNKLSNLTIMDAREHQRMESLRKHREGLIRPPGWLARKRAAEWHASEDGINWHSQHGKKTWENRSTGKAVCRKCGVEFDSHFPSRSKWCSIRCKSLGRSLFRNSSL